MSESNQDFEYDTESEADDEGYGGTEDYFAAEADDEADDEGAEADDEDFATEDDEFYQAGASTEADDEADDEMDVEADDESALDEAVRGAAARWRARAQKSQAQQAKRIVVDQKREVQRANATQRNLTSQIRAIQPGAAAKVQTAPPLQGAGVVTAILPNGRRSRMRIVPTVAPISEVNRLQRTIAVNDRRQAIATTNNSRAIQRLKAAQTVAIKKLLSEQVKSDKELRKRLLESDSRLDKRISKELTGGSGAVDKHGKRMMAMVKRQRQRSILNSVLIASSLPLYAAYGDREKPHAKNNLILTGSLIGWMMADEIADQFSSKSGFVKGGANIWSWAAPVGNIATSYFFLNDKQHERFISGIANVPAGAPGKVSLNIGKGSLEDFKAGTYAAVATVVSGGGDNATVLAQVSPTDGTLTLTVDVPGTTAATAATVAWMVDTRATSAITATAV